MSTCPSREGNALGKPFSGSERQGAAQATEAAELLFNTVSSDGQDKEQALHFGTHVKRLGLNTVQQGCL
jgi:hypothetical protein